jgi:hypothetical protein
MATTGLCYWRLTSSLAGAKRRGNPSARRRLEPAPSGGGGGEVKGVRSCGLPFSTQNNESAAADCLFQLKTTNPQLRIAFFNPKQRIRSCGRHFSTLNR